MVASCKWTIALGLFITAILLAGCQSHENENKYLLEGFVVSKDASKHSITISHGDIAGFMLAMTMSYEVRDSAAFKEIERGDMLRADLYVKNGSMVRKTIQQGRGIMPPLGRVFSKEDLDELIAYLHSK